MTWTRPSIQTIYDRIKADMESRVTDGVKIPRISLLGILNMAFSGAIHLTYGFQEWLAKQLFVDTATSFGLTRWGNILGLPQKAATYTTGTVSFTGTAAYVVASGTTVVNTQGYEYTTQAAYTIGTSTTVAIEAAAASAEYNTEENELELGSPDADVDSAVTVESGLDDGTDLETTEAWILRLLQRFQNPPSSGNVADYIRWALEVDGVGKAWCFPAEEWLGAGTVGVGVATEDLAAVSASILTDVEAYIEGVRPIPAAVDYFTIVPVATIYEISITPNTEEIRDAIDAQLLALHIAESAPNGTLLLSHMRQAIAAAGPDDYEITAINLDGVPSGVVSITTVTPDTAVFNSVVYSDL